MTDLNTWIAFINGVGFPIVASVYLAVLHQTSIKNFKKSIDANTQSNVALQTTINTFIAAQTK